MRRGLCCVATFLISIIARQAVNSRFSLVTIGTSRATSSIQKRSRAAGMKSCNLRSGFEGLRISGNAFWIERNRWSEFREYEQELDESLEDRPMLVLCTYSLSASRAVDVLDVARAHQFTVARRRGQWEFLETPELKQAKREIKSLGEALRVLSRSFAGHELLTPRERIVLAQIVRGASRRPLDCHELGEVDDRRLDGAVSPRSSVRMERRHGRQIDDGTFPLRRNHAPGERLSHVESAGQA